MIDWDMFYFWNNFGLDAITIIGCLGVLASIPIGAVIGKRLRIIIKGNKIYHNPNNRQNNPCYEKYPYTPVNGDINKLGNHGTSQDTTHNPPEPLIRFVALFAHIKHIISRIKRLCNQKQTKPDRN